MAADGILVRFLLLLTFLFFFPRLIHSAYKIPAPITELFIGIAVALIAPSFFTGSEMVAVLSTIGIITLFVFAGLEADVTFLEQKKRVFIENILIQLALFAFMGFIINKLFGYSMQVSLLISIAIITPSASFILATIHDLHINDKRWIEAKALSTEIIGIVLMAILIGVSDAIHLAITVAVLISLVALLPKVLEFLYKHIFSKLVKTEFPFILVIAIVSAFITELIGLHFLVGAFIAGLVTKRFVQDLRRTLSQRRTNEIIQGIGFFAATFTPFYFFSIGLLLTRKAFSIAIVAAAFLLFIVVSALRLGLVYAYRRRRIHREQAHVSLRISMMLLPTLVFTVVIAEILLDTFFIPYAVFAVLVIYGILTSMAPLLLAKRI